jgi:RimJ/RimL family protein N-acetyltransferase
MIRIEPLEDKDFETVARWNQDKPQDFIVQWAGPKFYEYPLTAAFLQSHHAGHSRPGADTYIYRVMLGGEMIGTVQFLRFNPEEKSAVVGRFLIGDESARGKGYGRQALSEMVKLGFEEFGLNTIKLSVFDFNTGAKRCYESVGFETFEYEPNVYVGSDGKPWGLYRMKITSYQWKAAEGC